MRNHRYHVEPLAKGEKNPFPGAYRIRGYAGVACHVLGYQAEPDEDTEWSGMEVRTGRLVAVMVGDDHRFLCDEEDVSRLKRSEYCGECGQIGCGCDAYPDEDEDEDANAAG